MAGKKHLDNSKALRAIFMPHSGKTHIPYQLEENK
jgi:hypothetical protein